MPGTSLYTFSRGTSYFFALLTTGSRESLRLQLTWFTIFGGTRAKAMGL